MKIKTFKILILALTIFCFSQNTYSQDEVSDYEKELLGNDADALSAQSKKGEEPDLKDLKVDKVTELGKLVPFSDIAVIQKRFLPKTNRFEFYPNIGYITNNAFFFNGFFQGRLGYALTEKWAVEATLTSFFNSEYKVTEDLKGKGSVKTESLSLAKSYYGADLRWSPIYGKMGLFNEGIVPFDMYFSLGGGVVGTNQDTNPFAIHVGTGQIYAIKKWMAFRWDISGYFYSSKTKVFGAGTGERSETFSDVQVSVGMSFFFPGAKYR